MFTKKIVIEYDVVNCVIKIDCDDLSAFESFGLLEAAKAMVADQWMKKDD